MPRGCDEPPPCELAQQLVDLAALKPGHRPTTAARQSNERRLCGSRRTGHGGERLPLAVLQTAVVCADAHAFVRAVFDDDRQRALTTGTAWMRHPADISASALVDLKRRDHFCVGDDPGELARGTVARTEILRLRLCRAGPLSTLRVRRCSGALPDAALGAPSQLRMLAIVRLLAMYGTLPRVRRAVLANGLRVSATA